MATHEADRSRLDRAADYLAKSRHALQLDTQGVRPAELLLIALEIGGQVFGR